MVLFFPGGKGSMTKTEEWINGARKKIQKAKWGGRKNLVVCLHGILKEIDSAQAQIDLGCGELCSQCSWGSLGGQALPRETCKLLAFQEAIKDLQERPPRAIPTRQEVSILLERLDELPVSSAS
jgi:hypothetical protein